MIQLFRLIMKPAKTREPAIYLRACPQTRQNLRVRTLPNREWKVCGRFVVANIDHAIVDGISASLSNMPVIGYQKMNPAAVAYSLATDWSQDDYNRATQWGMAWEDGRAFTYNDANSCYGTKGCSSTSVAAFDPSATDVASYIQKLEKVKPNEGRKRRCEAIRYGPDANLEKLKKLEDAALARQSYMAVNSATEQTFYINVRCSLAHLDPFFKTAPMSKNGLWRIEFFLNIASMTVVLEGGATALGATAKDKTYKTVAVTTSNGYNPLQLGSLAANDGIGPMATVTGRGP
jgi:hypothetical protein